MFPISDSWALIFTVCRLLLWNVYQCTCNCKTCKINKGKTKFNAQLSWERVPKQCGGSFHAKFLYFPRVISFISELDNKLSPSKMVPGNNEETDGGKKQVKTVDWKSGLILLLIFCVILTSPLLIAIFLVIWTSSSLTWIFSY